MDGTKLARIRTCLRCEYRSTRHSSHWRWPHCDGGPGSVELDEGHMEGPDSNCPKAKWAGLIPVDLEAEAEASRNAGIENEIAKWKRMLDILSPDEKTADAIRGKIEQLVGEGIIRYPETAAALEVYVGQR